MLNRFRLAAPQDGAATLSRDEQAMEIVMAVAGKPRFLLPDAPTGGMSLAERRTKGELLRPLRAHRTGMLRNPKPLLLD